MLNSEDESLRGSVSTVFGGLSVLRDSAVDVLVVRRKLPESRLPSDDDPLNRERASVLIFF